MSNFIKTIYVIHHSHTDIGYTDIQERVIDSQVDYIIQAINFLRNKDNKNFRWNCETYFCIEQFLKLASDKNKELFFNFVKDGLIGISATYLNFNDLVDSKILQKRIKEIKSIFNQENIDIKTAMIADINGISMGQRDALINNGIEFLYTNIHTHHGMYPLYQNQNAYYWKNKDNKQILVWNGEHYNLGNVLGIMPNKNSNFMMDSYLGEQSVKNSIDLLKDNLNNYIMQCENNGYTYDFIITSVSGVFSDNAPPNLEILYTIEKYNDIYGKDINIKMVSLQELYFLIKDKLKYVPVYSGDLTDWWANGVGSTPYAVKHYRQAQKIYHMCGKLFPNIYDENPIETRIAEDNLLLYAEHTWGHSSTISNPYDTMVLNLDMRKNSYCSKAHEASCLLINKVSKKLGDIFRYYNTNGKIKSISMKNFNSKLLIQFYIETINLFNLDIIDISTQKSIDLQLSRHPRGVLVSFIDSFSCFEHKQYIYNQLPPIKDNINTRKAYIGAERVRDIVNDYDSETYHFPYELDNEWFKIQYEIGKGITSFYNKKYKSEMLGDKLNKFFTPIYECTELRKNSYEERRLIGRNIRGIHAKCYEGNLIDIHCLENGKIFTEIELIYKLKGTKHCSVIIKFFKNLPKIDFKLQIAKTFSENIESIFLPLSLKLSDFKLYLKKGTTPFRPGIDQIPGTCMEYYMTDIGMVYLNENSSMLINTLDVPLVYMGELKHHPIKLCDGLIENNKRNIYSWIMNNTWETNFKMDLSGCCEFCYSLEFSDLTQIEECFETLDNLDTFTFITE